MGCWLGRREKRAPLPVRFAAAEVARSPSAAAAALAEQGAVRVDGVCPASGLAEYADVQIAGARKALAAGAARVTDRFAEHLCVGPQAGKRFDCKVPLDGEARDALALCLGILRPLLLQMLGPDAELFELSVIVSEPGAPAQTPHPDFPPYGDVAGPVALVVFLALDDLTCRLGPTESE